MAKKSIVVPLDGSALAEKALPFAIALVNRGSYQLLLLRLVPDQAHSAGEIVQVKRYLEEVQHEITLPDLAGRIDPANVGIQVVTGKPEKDLAGIVTELDAALVVMTTHGRTGLARLIMGSVANHLLDELRVPLILQRPANLIDSELPLELMYGKPEALDPAGQVVITLDGTLEAEMVIPNALEIANLFNFTVCLLQVVQPHDPLAEGVNFAASEDLKQRQAQAVQYLEAVQQRLVAKGTKCQTKVVIGEPAQEIINYAKYTSVVMLAMASHTRAGLERLLLGSVAQTVLTATHLPVMLIRPSVRAS